ARNLHTVGIPLFLAGALGWLLQSLDELDHAYDGQRAELSGVRIVNSARNVTVGVRVARRSEAIERVQDAIHKRRCLHQVATPVRIELDGAMLPSLHRGGARTAAVSPLRGARHQHVA